MTTNEALQIFRDTGALLEGHFILRSGLHSRQYFQCALALQQMPIVEKLGAALAPKVRPFGAVTVVSPAMGGLVIGQEVARQLGIRFIFVEKEEGKLALRRGFKIQPGEKILIVEDVVTKGGRVQETIDIVRANQGNVVGVAMGFTLSAALLQNFEAALVGSGNGYSQTLGEKIVAGIASRDLDVVGLATQADDIVREDYFSLCHMIK